MKLKNILIIALSVLAVSCNNIELAGPEMVADAANDYGMIISVDGQNSLEPQTKARKTAWENGDKIYVFTEGTSTGYFTLTYNKSQSKWNVTKTGTIDERFLNSGTGAATDKKVMAIHVPFTTLTPTNTDGTWTLATGDVYYTYDANVSIEHNVATKHYVKVQITLKAPTNFVQIYVNHSRVNKYTGSAIGGSTLACNNMVKLTKLTIDGDFTLKASTKSTTGTSGEPMTGRNLTGASEGGTVFYGAYKSDQSAPTSFTMNSGPVVYTYTVAQKLTASAYNMTESGWKQLLKGTYTITVGTTDYTVQFTPGNLQANYNAGNPKWHIAENQYDIIGSQDISQYKTKTGGQYPWYDLFGWGATGQAVSGQTPVPFWEVGGTSGSATEQAKFRSDMNTANANLAANDDWGANVIDACKKNTYHALTNAQWKALLGTYRPVKTYITINSVKHYGMVIQPSGTPATSYTESAWKTAEMNGAVFFPTAGHRNGNTSLKFNTAADGDGFFYWSRTLSNDTGKEQSTYKLPYGFGVYSAGQPSNVYTMVNWRSTGRAVRLAEIKAK